MEVDVNKVVNQLLQKIALLELENAKLTVALEEKSAEKNEQDDA